MRTNDIKIGETYFFLATDSAARKHLEGTNFLVTEIKPVWRRFGGASKRVKRFFNEFGEGARAEELEPMSQREFERNYLQTPSQEEPRFGQVDPGTWPKAFYKETGDNPF